jgi:hypothetical protein
MKYIFLGITSLGTHYIVIPCKISYIGVLKVNMNV